MFEGKIRPCLKCGEEGKFMIEPCPVNNVDKIVVACGCQSYHQRLSIRSGGTTIKAANGWNLANTPPEDITHLKYYYARFNMTLPGLEEKI